MKVLVIGSVYPRFQEDAEVPWLRTSIAHLKKAGVEIQVLAPAYKGLKSHDIDGTHVNRFRYAPTNWEILTHEEGAPSKMASKPWLQLLAIPYIINGFFQCLRICRKWKPDVIHAHWPFPHGYIALGAAKLFRIPLVLNFHGAELLLIRKKKWVKPLLKFVIGQAQAIFANSSFTASKIKALRNVNVEWSPYGTTLETSRLQGECRNGKFICRYDRTAAPDAEGVKDESGSTSSPTMCHPEQSLHFVHDSSVQPCQDASILSRCSPCKSFSTAGRETIKFQSRDPDAVTPHAVNGKFKILFVGRHIERKGITYLIEAAKHLPADQFEIRIVGVGDLTEQLKKQAEELDERRKTKDERGSSASSPTLCHPEQSLHFVHDSSVQPCQDASILSRCSPCKSFSTAGRETIKFQSKDPANFEPANIIFTGKLSPEDLANEYRTANVFTLPAIVDSKGDTEGLGVVLIEAMELGLPIVASNVGGIPDVVVDGESGILVPEKNPVALADAFKRLATDSSLTEHLLAGARKRISECFTWDGIIERQVEVYKKVISD